MTLQDIFEYRLDTDHAGQLIYTGLRPTCGKFERNGSACPLTWISTASAQSARSPGNRYRWRSPRPLETSASDPDGLRGETAEI